jgi:hypothetical protein
MSDLQCTPSWLQQELPVMRARSDPSVFRSVQWAFKPHSLPTALTFGTSGPITQKPSSLSFCIKATLCWPQLGCKRIPTVARSAIRSPLPLIHLRLGPLGVLISPQHHLVCTLHQEITQSLSKMLALSSSGTPKRTTHQKNIPESPAQISQKLPHQERHCLNIPTVTCLASRSSLPMHRHRLQVPKTINLSAPSPPHSGEFNSLNP